MRLQNPLQSVLGRTKSDILNLGAVLGKLRDMDSDLGMSCKEEESMPAGLKVCTVGWGKKSMV